MNGNHKCILVVGVVQGVTRLAYNQTRLTIWHLANVIFFLQSTVLGLRTNFETNYTECRLKMALNTKLPELPCIHSMSY